MPAKNGNVSKAASEAGGEGRNVPDGSFLALPSFGAAGGGGFGRQLSEQASGGDKGAGFHGNAPEHGHVLLSDYGDEDEDEEETHGETRSKNKCFAILVLLFRIFFPDATPFLMYLTQFAVSAFLCFMRASEGGTPLNFFFGLYLGFSLALWLIFLTGRVIWVYLLSRYIALPASKLYTILASVLDPESVYLAFTIALAVFWNQALEVTTEDASGNVIEPPKYGPSTVWYVFLGIPRLMAAASPRDRNVLCRMEYVLIIWASQNVIMKVIMFYFLVGFLRNVNGSLVKFLTLYSLMRKLNANWIRLTPVLNELARAPSAMPPVNPMEELFPEYPRGTMASAVMPSGEAGPNATAHLWSATPSASLTATAAAVVNNQLNDVSLVEAPFAGPHGPAVPATFQPATSQFPSLSHAAQVVDELLAAEALTKERKQTRSGAGGASFAHASLRRLQTIVDASPKRKEPLKKRYQIEFTGRVLPTQLLRKNIEETERSGIANLIAIQYVQNNPVVLFVRGTRVELHSKGLARLVGNRLFEELIELRNAIAPDDELSAEQMDLHVKQSVIQTAELQQNYNRQASSQMRLMPPAAQPSAGERGDHAAGHALGSTLQYSGAGESFGLSGGLLPVPGNVANIVQAGGRGSRRETPNTASPQSPPPSIPVPLAPLHPLTPPLVPPSATAAAEPPRRVAPVSQDVENSTAHPVSAAYEINVKAPRSEEEESRSSSNPLGHQDEDVSLKQPQLPEKRTEQYHGAQPPRRSYGATDYFIKREEGQEITPPEPMASQDGPAIPLRRNEQMAGAGELKAAARGRSYLTRELFELFMGEQVGEFMKYADPGGRDRVAVKEFTRMIVELYQLRKQLILLLASQEGIHKVFRRMVSIFLGFLAILVFLVVVGVSANTIIISGAASVSSITVALSFLYSGFIQSVMFVCFFNPYNVGDRVRLNDELLIVKKVSTYFSEFVSVPYNKPSFWNHSTLYNMIVINESRCRNAGLEIPIVLAYDTNPEKYDQLHNCVLDYVNNHGEFVKGSSFYLLNDIVVGHYIKFTYWISCTESWHRWKAVLTARTRLWLVIAHQCQVLGINYRLPIQPIALRETKALGQLSYSEDRDIDTETTTIPTVPTDPSQHVVRRRR